MEKHYTLSKAAELLGVTAQTVRNWDKVGKIKAIRTPGNQRRIPESEVLRLQGFDIEAETAHTVTPQPEHKPPAQAEEKQQQKAPPIVSSVSQNAALLMCKNVAVYNITQKQVLNESLVPGSILRNTMDYPQWSKTRYSSETNFSARRLMQRAFEKYDYEYAAQMTRALSLSDCYWLKKEDEDVTFESITPYLIPEWDGEGAYPGGAISTLFVNGTRDKHWVDAQTLLKKNSNKELDVYNLCIALGLDNGAQVQKSDEGLLLTNFTSLDCFYESMEQSGYVEEGKDPRIIAVEKFKDTAVALFVVDYLVENNDRHIGNYGFLRCANTGEYIAMAPYYDFDWAWTGEVAPLPDNAWQGYSEYIRLLCRWAIDVSASFEYNSIIERRANELLSGIH